MARTARLCVLRLLPSIKTLSDSFQLIKTWGENPVKGHKFCFFFCKDQSLCVYKSTHVGASCDHVTLQVAVVLGPRAEHPRGGGSSVQHEDLRRKRSMYLSSKTLEDATVSCPLGEYAVGYLQCIVLKTQHNVESCGREDLPRLG